MVFARVHLAVQGAHLAWYPHHSRSGTLTLVRCAFYLRAYIHRNPPTDITSILRGVDPGLVRVEDFDFLLEW